MSDDKVKDAYTISLDESAIPTHWYNLVADLPEPPPPPLNPATREPLQPADLAAIFPMGLIAQEATTERYVEIPAAVREVYKLWRPSPLHRAYRLEKAVNAKARIYYKYEGASPVGSHKTNSSVAQAYYNSLEGVQKLTTETGAGQWGSALAFACQLFGLECEVWQVRASFDSKPYRRMLMETFGGAVHSSPSELTSAGRTLRERFPDTSGSLGMAISEAVEAAATNPAANYALGSVLNHVLLHQTVIGQETTAQLKAAGVTADAIFGCAGGGSNLAGLSFPFLGRNLTDGATTRVVAAEPSACPSLTQGEYRYDSGDVAGLTPLLKMYTLGSDFVPPAVHAGGLRYHGMAPLVSYAYNLGLLEAVAIHQRDAFAAGVTFARAEGIVPAAESTHAIAACLAEASKEEAAGKVYLIGVSGNGQLDLPAYADFLAGAMDNA